MNNQKNRFWTFCLSLVPGAGEMYFGLYRQGVSLMLTFIALCVLPMMIGMGALFVFAAVVWFYSFLHTHNLRALPLEEFCRIEDRWFWPEIDLEHTNVFSRIVAVVLILVGAGLLWQNLFSWVYWFLPDGPLEIIFRNLPETAVGALILLLGVWLIRGKKKELQEEPEEPVVAEAAPVQAEPAPTNPAETGEEADHADA